MGGGGVPEYCWLIPAGREQWWSWWWAQSQESEAGEGEEEGWTHLDGATPGQTSQVPPAKDTQGRQQ